MADKEEESAWIDRSRQGDHEAFESLIASYQHMIHSLTFRMTGSMADAEDLAQETFIQAHQRLADFRSESRFSSWLYRIAINLCLNWRKRSGAREKLHTDWSHQQASAVPAPDNRLKLIQSALQKLNPAQRAAIVLTTYEGLNHAEAARVLGCSETTVSWRLFTARAKLRKLLGAASAKEAADE